MVIIDKLWRFILPKIRCFMYGIRALFTSCYGTITFVTKFGKGVSGWRHFHVLQPLQRIKFQDLFNNLGNNQLIPHSFSVWLSTIIHGNWSWVLEICHMTETFYLPISFPSGLWKIYCNVVASSIMINLKSNFLSSRKLSGKFRGVADRFLNRPV